MINGKFFTGLPPKMIDRVGSGKNRLESHLFWPDDSNTMSATEARAKGKVNLQHEGTENSKEAPVQEDVNTRRMFHKEFANSSILFYDNLQEHREPNQSTLRSKLAKKCTSITPKPTTTRPELPESAVDEVYTKKQQAYTSKIEFNDCMDKNFNNTSRHIIRKLKMDMNSKKDLERNTENSPKLHNKSNVRNLRTNEVDKFSNDCIYKSMDDEEKYGRKKNVDEHSTSKFYNRDESNFESFALQNSYDYEDESKLNYIDKNMKNMTVHPKARQIVKNQNNYYDEYHHRNVNNERFYEDPNISCVRSQHKSPERRPIFSNYDARHKVNDYQYKNSLQKPATSSSENHIVGARNHYNNSRYPRIEKPNPNTSPVKEITTSLWRPSEMNLSSPESVAGFEVQLSDNHHYMDPPKKTAAGDRIPTERRRYARNTALQRVSVGLPD